MKVTGRDLWIALGYGSERAFQRACAQKKVPVRLYPILGQSRGVYARADELAAYLAKKTSNDDQEGSP